MHKEPFARFPPTKVTDDVSISVQGGPGIYSDPDELLDPLGEYELVETAVICDGTLSTAWTGEQVNLYQDWDEVEQLVQNILDNRKHVEVVEEKQPADNRKVARYRVTKPVYFTCTVEADSAEAAFEAAVCRGEGNWEEDDPQPLVESYDCSIELEEPCSTTK